MNELLFLVTNTGVWYGHYESAVVVSDTTENAYKVAQDISEDFMQNDCSIEYIGIAASGLKLGDIVCTSYLGD